MGNGECCILGGESSFMHDIMMSRRAISHMGVRELPGRPALLSSFFLRKWGSPARSLRRPLW